MRSSCRAEREQQQAVRCGYSAAVLLLREGCLLLAVVRRRQRAISSSGLYEEAEGEGVARPLVLLK